MTEDYQNLIALYRNVILNKQALAMLEWDRAVMMPEKGAVARSEIQGFLSTQAHAVLISDDMSDRLQSATARADSLPDAEQADLKLMAHQIRQAHALPGDLVGALSRQASICEYHWHAARQNADFAMVLPHAEKLLDLKREEADILAEDMDVESRYEALLDQYDPGRRTAEIDRLFAPLAEKLPKLLADCVAHQPETPPVLPKMAIADQRALGREVAADLGFDFSAGRLDVSAHPFSGGISDDVRMTARYEEDDFWSGLLAVIHETGHGLYDGGMPEKWRYAAIGQSFNIGMTGHEAMSLFMEKQIALRSCFLSYFSRKTAEVTGLQISPQSLQDKARHVSHSFIRTEADEISYPLHIILRMKSLLIN
ncbi:MAG: carboxypeptidase M32 [Pseudomonadota bacterium]